MATSTSRSAIAAALQLRHDQQKAKAYEELLRREAQRDRTRSLVRIMQLDTRDELKIALHAENASHYNQRTAVLEQIRVLQDHCQAEKKRLQNVKDKKERHERLQRAKAVRDRDVAVLRLHLEQLDASAPAVVRPGSSSYVENVSRAATPTELVSDAKRRTERVSATEFKQLMDQIRQVKLGRKEMLDPYVANLKLARLWDRLRDTARCLENYDAACRMMKEKDLVRIPTEMMEETLEKQRLRRRAALQYLFTRALQRKQRKEAVGLLTKFIDLALPEDRLKDLAYVDRFVCSSNRYSRLGGVELTCSRILREQEYIEDPTLASPDEITFAIRNTNSLGQPPFQIAKRDAHCVADRSMCTANRASHGFDLDLIESVANIHVRRGEFDDAEKLTSRFIALPPVKGISLYASLAELRCGM
ncbi:hypothetical protein P3T76_013281 [Phytophthora citrophthora]|uniref:Uncharacterized protein n=1 Tax=Phytophthora citrophthora TaxID=4793 RepID=A0AAD9G436_9STRA|nr:hypothetical protein P3T76_013281 [Phytophthora citrophthora]